MKHLATNRLTRFLWLKGKAFCLISPLADEDDNKMLTLLFNQFTKQTSKYFAKAIYHVVFFSAILVSFCCFALPCDMMQYDMMTKYEIADWSHGECFYLENSDFSIKTMHYYWARVHAVVLLCLAAIEFFFKERLVLLTASPLMLHSIRLRVMQWH